ncbi:CPBP family intramembrane glutamic endopeptidase [Rhodoluna lacicola]|uniref:CPBP family intramembrane glutamic endopeptidase n=1 Tax=Rhodoluna lacicola TaxID=529884 RepID=UPI00223118F6|nr:CPBP family intramembrane glutamic endopeptidase [Rhodoluna lacicola]BDS50619.1 CAAX amino protease [Rhodoluna lacicola]
MTNRKQITSEIIIVFALSLGASAVYSIVSLIAKLTAEAGLAGQTTLINGAMAQREWLDFTYQILSIAFGLAPVALALYLLWQSVGRPFEAIGLQLANPGFWIWRGFALAAVIGIPGLALYVGSRLLGISSKIVPADLNEYWWTIPILLLAAVKAALLEEVLVIGYLFDRLQRLGIMSNGKILISAALRGSYHLYQGFGGFIGNFVMGLVFGWAYKKWGRVMPLVLAHFILDAVSFVGYSLIGNSLPLP